MARDRFIDRKEFANYVLRQLGAGVFQIELTDDQINDVIDDVLDFFGRYHSDGSGRHIIVLPREDLDQVEFDMPENTISVVRTLYGRYSYIYSGTKSGSYTDYLLFRPYSMIHHLAGNDGQILTPLWISETFYNTFLNMLVPEPTFRFSEVTGKLILNSSQVRQAPNYNDSALYVEAFSMYDENNYPKIFSHDWVRRYAVAKMGLLWGDVLSKFDYVPTAGGTKLNGEKIVKRYQLKVDELEEEARFAGHPPTLFLF